MYSETVTKKAPSSRNREIFRDVRVELQSLRTVAKARQLSPGRVGRIVKQVESWIGETAGSAPGTDWQQRLFVMEEIHRQRLDLLFQQALVGWEKSQQAVHTDKLKQVAGKPDVREVTVKSSAGDRRFLETALKIEESRRKFEEHSEQIQQAGPQGAGEKEKEVATALPIPNSQLEINAGVDGPLSTDDKQQPASSPVPSPQPPVPAPRPKQGMIFTPRVLSAAAQRALIHPSRRLPRGEW